MSSFVVALSVVDWGVLAVYLLAMVAIGAYFSHEQHTSRDFFLAGRSMGWFPVGLSIMATLLSALSYSGIPGAAYEAGYKFLILPVSVWLTLPIVSGFILPLYQRLEIYSVYEYLELRFDASVRFVSSVVFVVWRLLWMGGVLYAPCKVLVVAAGIDVPVWVLLLILGACGTAYTFLGGMKAVIWTDVVQSLVMVAGLVLIIGCVWWKLDGGPTRVQEIASGLGRSSFVETSFRWDSYWTIWGILPHLFLSMLSFYIADQITAQRYLTAKSLPEARRSFVLNCVSVSIMTPALAYVGVALLAFYYDNPQAMEPKWVANLSSGAETRALTYQDRAEFSGETLAPEESALADQPLIDWNRDTLNASTVEALVSERRILRPNSKQPFESAEELLDEDTGRLRIEALAMRKPPNLDSELSQGEMILNGSAKDELMPRFITRQLPVGVAGLILAALFAASMSSMDSGLNSICTLLIMDFHRRLGWGRAWLATRRQKPIDQLTEEDELRLGRPLVLFIGVAATLFSLLVSQVDDIFSIMIAIVNTFGGPLMAVFLLGIFTRRATAASAMTALVLGTAFTIWMQGSNSYSWMAWMWPFEQKFNGIWPLTFGVVLTLVIGYLLGFVCGRGKSREQLRGLVWGIGELGRREADVVAPLPSFGDEGK
ncbi:MAG: hypothetical protein KDA38_04905 [Planctomycetales bacterium]|nr:hypothetical protein [Planctomycetales bacterium]